MEKMNLRPLFSVGDSLVTKTTAKKEGRVEEIFIDDYGFFLYKLTDIEGYICECDLTKPGSALKRALKRS